MHINKAPNIICKNHCSKKHIMDNGLIWCEQTEIGNFCCVISDDKIKKLIDYEKEKDKNGLHRKDAPESNLWV